jgi:hypothetical protein
VSDDLSMVRGDTPTWGMEFSRAGSAIDLTGAAIRFTAKRDLSDADASAVFQKQIGDGVVVLGDGTTGEAEVSLLTTDTSSLLDRDITLHCDVQIVEAGGRVSSFRKKLYVTCDVTEAVV